MDDEKVLGLGLADAIRLIREDLLAARAAGAAEDIQLPIESLTVELHVAATRTHGGKAGFRVPFLNAEIGGTAQWESENMQVVTVTFGSPVDRLGHPVKVAEASDSKKH